MKLQIQEQNLRFRIDENELATLLSEELLVNTLQLPNGEQFMQSLRLIIADSAALETTALTWCLILPKAIVEAYVERLPCRDALTFALGDTGNLPLTVQFEVDVRDSVKKRGRATKKP
ncbi:hypothetical protein GCM10010960_00520 [Arenimonas maotaiensis]|uniref:Uncharacterized protein n=1 Tax=Arenimonas maotaiensis TaxID=1446479 RepID=A0A917CBK5_9GAMM|nr:hypothetical protein [Arenimonas maotaiensis]GGF82358.1 hypothetical protein GCM10010960_00520 [Arenimonas maotaiensis]